MEDCHRREIVRIECPNCKLNFCLNEIKFEKPSKEVTHEVKPKKVGANMKVLNEVEQRRADRIAVMKLKSKIKVCDGDVSTLTVDLLNSTVNFLLL
uniref:Uncharacterized protein n=1 Tax=Parascaris equorum TaxID=6256 RepID=A0A914RK73_PAREQ